MFDQIDVATVSEPMTNAMRILVRYNNGFQLGVEEMDSLKQHPAWVKQERLRIDELAWKVIRHELAKGSAEQVRSVA